MVFQRELLGRDQKGGHVGDAAAMPSEFAWRMLETVGDGVCVLRSDGVVRYCNPALAALLGAPVNRLVGRNVLDFLRVAVRQESVTFLEELAAEGTHREVLFRGTRAVDVPVALLARRLSDTLPRDYLLVATDLRPEKRYAALLASEQTLRESEAQYRCDAERAAEVISERDKLTSLVTHDLRNPLGAILVQTELLCLQLERGPSDPARLTTGLNRILRAGLKMERLLDELLDIARIQAGQPLEFEFEDAELVGVVRRIIDDLQEASPRHQLSFRSSRDKLDGRWDVGRLERAIENLLSNAIKYSPNGGPVETVLECAGDGEAAEVSLRVTDSGLGIAEQDRPYIFHWFGRGEKASRSIRGTGLGLAGARQIVEQHGGQILVDSAENKGSTFTIKVPLIAQKSASQTGQFAPDSAQLVDTLMSPDAQATASTTSVPQYFDGRSARAALQASEDKFQLLVESVVDCAVFILDPTGHITTWNIGAERINGYKSEEIIGKHFSIFYTPDAVAANHPQHELELAIRDGRYSEEGWRVRKDGSQFFANVVISTLRDAEGRVCGFGKVTRDLTDKKLAEDGCR